MKVKPCGEQNAIKVVAFALEFQREFSAGELSVLLSLHKGDDDDLPHLKKHEAFTFQFNQGGHQPVTTPTALGGVTFSELRANGEPKWSFIAQGNSVIVRCTEYTRWEEVWAKTNSYLQRFLPVLTQNNPTIAVGLEYLDEFLVLDPNSSWAKELFRSESAYLPKYILGLSDFWHAHSGFFSRVDEQNDQMLTKINLDYIKDEKGVFKVASTTHHKVNLSEPEADFDEFAKASMLHFINTMHDMNKSVMKELLTDQMLNAIRLEG